MKDFKHYSYKYDFVIVGGGLTGLCAAVSAARHGTKVALIQDRPMLGGNASSEIRMHICGASTNNAKPDLCEGGILHELMLANKRVNDSFNFSVWDAVMFDTAKKERNLTLYLNTTMIGAECVDGTVTSIDCYQMTTEKRLTISADIFADCTGNGTLSAFVGARFRTGSESAKEFGEPDAPEKANNDRMGNTLLFKAHDTGHPVKFIPPVDIIKFSEEDLRYRKHTNERPKALSSMSDKEIEAMFGGICTDFGYWWIEIPGVGEDIISEYEDIRDLLVKTVYGVWDHIKNGGDHGAENYDLLWVGMLPGVRESRRIEADYMLNETDIFCNRRFEDAVAYGGWAIDLHVPGGIFAFDKLPSSFVPFDGSYDIPYRSYLVKDFKNLYVGGRCLGASKLAMASTRVMGTCAIGGQAIGTAAAQAIRDGVDIRSIDIHELQQTLLMDDCYLPCVENTDEKDLARRAAVCASSFEPGSEAENVIKGVSRGFGGKTNQWRSASFSDGEFLELKLDRRAAVSTVQIIFDSDFSTEKKIALGSRRQKQQKIGVPAELVRDFDVELFRNGAVVERREIRDNFQRLCRVKLDQAVMCDAVRIVVHATNGIDQARIFEVRIYE